MKMFPSSRALIVRPKIWAVDRVGPRCVFEVQQWRMSSTKFIDDREKHNSEFFDIKPTYLMSIKMMNYMNGTGLEVKNFFFWITEEIRCDLKLINRKSDLLRCTQVRLDLD